MGALATEIPLHEFMSSNRERLLAIATEKLRPKAPGRSDREVLDGTPDLFDEVVRALRREAGLADSSPLPGHSEVAANLGRVHQRTHDSIGTVAMSVGAISDAVGELGASMGLQFGAHEYHVFNLCLDTSTAAAIEEYAAEERAQQHHESSKRLGSLVHEIRNALSGARMSYSALKNGVIGINSRTGEVLERSLARMQELVNGGMAAAQLEAGIPPNRERIRVEELCRQLEAAAVCERGVQLQVQVDPALELEADERLLTSALGNLVQNGLKFTRDGSRVLLRAHGERGRIIFEVEDECGGLPAEQIHDLVLPFVQRGKDRRGLGLGLSIAQEAIEAHGGMLTVRNRPGQGCDFIVSLPGPPD